jgi:hypothetical protein
MFYRTVKLSMLLGYIIMIVVGWAGVVVFGRVGWTVWYINTRAGSVGVLCMA